MKARTLTILMHVLGWTLAASHTHAQGAARTTRPDPLSDGATQPAQLALSPYRNPDAVAKAVRETLAESPGTYAPSSGTALSGEGYREFARKFSHAAKPHCLGPDPLKHQPASTVIGNAATGKWNIGVGGIFALPFWGAAVLRGKCSWKD